MGIRKNVELMKRGREAVGPDGVVATDCWMALTERYTLELCEAFEPYNVYWMEERLPPDDYEGFGRLREQIKSTRIVSGEHVYARYGFRQLLSTNGAEIWHRLRTIQGGLQAFPWTGRNLYAPLRRARLRLVSRSRITTQ